MISPAWNEQPHLWHYGASHPPPAPATSPQPPWLQRWRCSGWAGHVPPHCCTWPVQGQSATKLKFTDDDGQPAPFHFWVTLRCSCCTCHLETVWVFFQACLRVSVGQLKVLLGKSRKCELREVWLTDLDIHIGQKVQLGDTLKTLFKMGLNSQRVFGLWQNLQHFIVGQEEEPGRQNLSH